MLLLARTLRYLATRYLADADRSSQHTARANAAEAHALLRQRCQEQADVDAYLRAQLRTYRGVGDTGSARESGRVERAR